MTGRESLCENRGVPKMSMNRKWWHVVVRVLVFSAASNAAVLFVFGYGRFFWPEGLPGWAHHIFWLANGVNVAGLLILGMRYWPVIVLDAVPAWLWMGQALDGALLGAGANAVEALLAVGMIRWLGGVRGGQGSLDRMRPTVVLLAVSLVTPLVNMLAMPGYFVMRGVLPREEFWKALGNWNLSNAGGMLLVGPLIWTVWRGAWSWRGRGVEFACGLGAVAVLAGVAFDSAFSGRGVNFTFLVFPAVLYMAVRFGWGEVSAALGVMVVMIYVTLGESAQKLAPGELAVVVWYVQAFSWALGATGFLIAAVSAQRRQAEERVMRAREKELEASLHAERARLEALRYQVNPHFLFNALNSVRASLPLSEAVAREMLTDLSGYLRSTLESGEGELNALRDEVRNVQEYLRIEQHRFTTRLRVEFAIEAGAERRQVPVFLLQPLVENAIRHGLERSKEPCEITVTAREERGGELYVEVRNTGRWREPGEKPGIGLASVRRRLALFHGNRASLQVATGEEWVCIQIRIA